jgi:hypothetical protein
MEPKNYNFGGGATTTVLHPIVLAALVIVTIVLLVLPRKYSIPAFFFGMFLIPAGQQVVLAGIHIYAFRFIVLAGLLRMLRFREKPLLAGRWNPIDTVFSLSIVSHAVAFALLYWEMTAVINQAGFIWDYIGGYVFLRYAIRNREDVVATIRCFALLAFVFGVCMIREQLTGNNIFGLLGGVRLISEVRQGHVRSEAVFQHAILAGSFGATLLPLFVLLWKDTQSKVLAAIAALSATAMVIASMGSTPLLAYAAGFLGIFLWLVRRYMRWLRWGLVIGLLCLSFVMHAPVWYIVAHVGVVSGSSGYQRADLLNTFLTHLNEWWLLGTDENSKWGYYMFDTSNQYVYWGVTGGLLSLILFIAIISRSFRRIGKARKSVEGRDPQSEWFVWLLGSALFANVVAFFGISYFDQTKFAWFALLAMISAATIADIPRKDSPATKNEYFTTPSAAKDLEPVSF